MLRTFETEEELYKKFKELCAREGIKVGDKLNKLIEEEVKVHGDGNPIFTLDKYADPDFKTTPAFGVNMTKWRDFISKCNPNEAEEIYNKATAIREHARNYLWIAAVLTNFTL